MYDSVTASDIPAGAGMVAGYVNGPFAWTHQDWLIHAGAVKVEIAISADYNGGHVLDCETGDATPIECPAWVQMRRAAGVDPTIYCDWSTWPTVRGAFNYLHVAEPHYWIAYWNGQAQVDAGMVAHQYANSAMAGGHYDLSAVADFWPGVDTSGPGAPDPGYSFGPPPGGDGSWAWKVPGTANPPHLGTPPGGNYGWEWIGLEIPFDVNSYPGGPTSHNPQAGHTPDPGYSFGPPPGGDLAWAWKRPGEPDPPRFGPTPGGDYAWEWIRLEIAGDVLSYPGGPHSGSPVVVPPPVNATIDGVKASWSKLAGLLNKDVPDAASALDVAVSQLKNL
jgi:hypothetical protein